MSSGSTPTSWPGDAASIPLPDAVADVVLSVFAVIFAPDPAAAAVEMSRITAPHGRIVLTSWVPEGVMADGMRTIGEAFAQAAGGAPGPGFAWHDQDEVQALFTEHGMLDELRGRVMDVLRAGNEDPATCRITSRFRVLSATR